ncbi:uncharacterized protein LOC143461221 [Clavelina lepadiformis]|uniref:Uncharacterized protein n=1 Tax=Clavelina lepadiformis TaxID=159417 RepID=A0ABP0GCP2_CLALP
MGSSVFCLGLLLLATSQVAFAADGNGSAYLAPWLVGIIAVAVFLVLAFVFLLFNHYVCVKFYEKDEDYEDEETDDNTYEPVHHMAKKRAPSSTSEPSLNNNIYENTTFTNEDENVTQL